MITMNLKADRDGWCGKCDLYMLYDKCSCKAFSIYDLECDPEYEHTFYARRDGKTQRNTLRKTTFIGMGVNRQAGS